MLMQQFFVSKSTVSRCIVEVHLLSWFVLFMCGIYDHVFTRVILLTGISWFCHSTSFGYKNDNVGNLARAKQLEH